MAFDSFSERPFKNTVLQCIETLTEEQVDGRPTARGRVVILAYEDPNSPGNYGFYCTVSSSCVILLLIYE